MKSIRLACVKYIASVHPEPGSNSSLVLIYIIIISNNIKSLKENILCFNKKLQGKINYER